jgi:hypothetical protein
MSAFWSLTLYDTEGFMKHNELDRYSIGDRFGIKFNEEGSLELYIQHDCPVSGVRNWLPAPQEEFNVFLPLYYPKDSFTNNEWVLAALEKVEVL